MAISARAAGTWAYAASGSVTTTLPTHATGDMLLVRVAYKSSAIATCLASTATSGWSKLGEFHDGTTNSGNGTGSVAICEFWKIATSASETNPTITFSQTVTQVGHVGLSFQRGGSDPQFIDPVGAGGPHTGGTSFTATMASNIGVKTGDMVVAAFASRDDTAFTVPTFTQTGVTFAAVTEYPAAAGIDASGADGSYDGCYRLATAGTSSAAAVLTATLAATETGSAWQTRLRMGGTGSFTANAVIRKTWTFPSIWWRSNPQGSTAWNDVATDGNYWVIVGDSGTLRYTQNPSGSWTSNNQGSTPFAGVAYGNGYWVAVGNSGALLYATDPTGAWTSNTQGSEHFTDVAYGNGYWVAVGFGGTIYYKATDPTGAWTSNPHSSSDFNGVAYGNGYWAAVGSGGEFRYRASDPTGAWTSNVFTSEEGFGIFYGNGYWVTNGLNSSFWYRASDPTGAFTANNLGLTDWSDVAYGNGYWVATSSGSELSVYKADNPVGAWETDSHIGTLMLAVASGSWGIVQVGFSGELRYTNFALTANAVIKREITPTFTADAVISAGAATIEGSFTANAVVFKTQTPTFAANAVIKKTFGTDTTYITLSNSGSVYSRDAVYATARAGASLIETQPLFAGQLFDNPGDYELDEAFLEFDTSWLGANAVVTTATLSLLFDGVGTWFPDASAIVRVRAFDYGTLTTADYIPGASLTANPLVAHIASGDIVGDAYNNLTDDGLAANINKTAPTRLVMATDHEETGTQPIGPNYFEVAQVSINDPNGFRYAKLDISWAILTANAVLRKTQSASLTANAVIFRTQSASFAADAIICRVIWEDNFNRTVGSGINPSSDGNVYQIYWGDDLGDPFYTPGAVDGSAYTIVSGGGFAFTQWRTPLPYRGLLQFDFWTATHDYYIQLGISNTDYLSVNRSSADTRWIIFTGGGCSITAIDGGGGDIPALDPNSWYTAKVVLDYTGSPTQRLKVWKVGTAEPDWQDTSNNSQSIPFSNFFYLDSDDGGTTKVDNLLIRSFAATFYTNAIASADAILRKTQSVSFSADALIVRRVLFDTFTRTVADGLGTADDGTLYQQEVGGTGLVSVDGTQAITTGDTGIGFVGYETPTVALVRFDFFVPADSTDSTLFYKIEGLHPTGWRIAIQSNGDGEWDASAGSADHLFTPDASTWYTIKAWVQPSTVARVKVWKSGDAEPDWQDEAAFGTNGVVPELYIQGSTLNPAKLDNLIILAASTPFFVYHQFTADAVISAGGGTVEVSFTANAILRKTQAASLNADAIVLRTQAASLTADAVIKREITASLTANAVVKATISASFTTNAVVRREQTASLTANAVIVRTIAASLTANAVVKATISRSLTADAVVFRTQSATFTANAVLYKAQSATFAADAILRVGRAASITTDAVILRTQTPTLSADAVIFRTITATFTADAVLMPSFRADAVVLRTQTASLTSDAVIMPVFRADAITLKTQAASFTADAFIQGTGVFAFSTDAVLFKTQAAALAADAIVQKVQTASLTADAVIFRTQTAVLTADAVLKREITATFTGDAVIRREQTATLTADAILRVEQTAALTANAVVLRTQAASLTADAVILREQAVTFTANAVVLRTQAAALTADAVIYKSQAATYTADAITRIERAASLASDAIVLKTQAAALAADAVLYRVQTASLTADAVIMPLFRADAIVLRTQMATLTADAVVMPVFRADAILRVERATSFTADAFIFGAGLTGFTADAVILRTQSATFTSDAVILRTQSATFTGDAVLKREQTATFGADAILRREQAAATTANAVILRSQAASLTADAVIRVTQSATFTADAFIQGGGLLTFSTDAVLQREQATTFTANAIVRIGRDASFTSDAMVSVPRSATFTSDAVIFKTQTRTLTGDALLTQTQTTSLTADAFFEVVQTATFTADALIVGGGLKFLTADALLTSPFNAEYTMDAWIALVHIGRISATITADTIALRLAVTPTTRRFTSFSTDAVVI